MVTLDFVYDGGGVGNDGTATLLVYGKPVADGRAEQGGWPGSAPQ